MYETEIEMKIDLLPEEAKREALDFIDFLTLKYKGKKDDNEANSRNKQKDVNPFIELAGMCEIGEMDLEMTIIS